MTKEEVKLMLRDVMRTSSALRKACDRLGDSATGYMRYEWHGRGGDALRIGYADGGAAKIENMIESGDKGVLQAFGIIVENDEPCDRRGAAGEFVCPACDLHYTLTEKLQPLKTVDELLDHATQGKARIADGPTPNTVGDSRD
jgi:hypothetical protein